ncbi:MAG TPA: UDP-N-acetylmuramate--L-alanine ligase [Pirellulales bacterium]|nr:UDP-N-acetylmuramate--L-alanine ligase [Pirellulales bacterium]
MLALQSTRVLPRQLTSTAQRTAHLIGIAGAGMQSLAEALVDQGWTVTGSDLAPEQARWLWSKGVLVHRGHAARQMPADARLVVYSDAVGVENPERQRAHELGLPEYSYPQMVGELMKGRIGLAVAGTHGKSTTTALTAEILIAAGLDPSVIGGGTPLGQTSGGRHGQGRYLLAEACEYHRNFLHLCPRLAALTGIEPDHFDCFPSDAELTAAFGDFVRRLPRSGTLVLNADCPVARKVAGMTRARIVTYGLDAPADWRAEILSQNGGRFQVDLLRPGGRIAKISLSLPGRHNLQNALAAAALAAQAGAGDEAIAQGLTRFAGLARRLERVGLWREAAWYDDYAHHPTAVRATLATVRQMFPSRRIWCIFQPHQVSRTRRLLDEFAASLQNADRVAIAEVFPAREMPGPACSAVAAELAERTRAQGTDVLGGHTLDRLADEVGEEVAAGDVLLTLGAGDIRKIWNATARRIRTYRAAG